MIPIAQANAKTIAMMDSCPAGEKVAEPAFLPVTEAPGAPVAAGAEHPGTPSRAAARGSGWYCGGCRWAGTGASWAGATGDGDRSSAYQTSAIVHAIGKASPGDIGVQ